MNETQLGILNEWFENQEPIIDQIVKNTLKYLISETDRNTFINYVNKVYRDTPQTSREPVRKLLIVFHDIAQGCISDNHDLYRYISPLGVSDVKQFIGLSFKEYITNKIGIHIDM